MFTKMIKENKIKYATGVLGVLSPLCYTYPQKFCVLHFQMQYHKPDGLWTSQEWNYKISLSLHYVKAVSQINVYHISQMKWWKH